MTKKKYENTSTPFRLSAGGQVQLKPQAAKEIRQTKPSYQLGKAANTIYGHASKNFGKKRGKVNLF